jgi:hypothetical protein
MSLVAVAKRVAAQVSVSPGQEGAPLGGLQRLLNLGAWAGLLVCALAVVVGAAMLGIAHTTNNQMAGNNGRKVIGGGLAGAALIGLAPSLVNWASALFR